MHHHHTSYIHTSSYITHHRHDTHHTTLIPPTTSRTREVMEEHVTLRREWVLTSRFSPAGELQHCTHLSSSSQQQLDGGLTIETWRRQSFVSCHVPRYLSSGLESWLARWPSREFVCQKEKLCFKLCEDSRKLHHRMILSLRLVEKMLNPTAPEGKAKRLNRSEDL